MNQEVFDKIGYEGMSADAEGVTDVASHSRLAILAFILLIVGGLAPIAPSLAMISGAGTLLAILVFILHPKKNYSNISIALASIVVLVGSCVTAWGITNQQTRQSMMYEKATSVAAKYMAALASGEMLTAIQMVGLEPVVADVSEDEMSPAQKAVRFYLEDYTLTEITKRGKVAKWKPQGVIDTYREGGSYVYRVRFVDESRDNPLPYDVIVMHTPPFRYAAEKVNRWMVDQVEQPSK